MSNAPNTLPEVKPWLVPIKQAQKLLSRSRRAIYTDIEAGKLVAVKYGRSTLITMESLEARRNNLPRANIGAAASPSPQ